VLPVAMAATAMLRCGRCWCCSGYMPLLCCDVAVAPDLMRCGRCAVGRPELVTSLIVWGQMEVVQSSAPRRRSSSLEAYRLRRSFARSYSALLLLLLLLVCVALTAAVMYLLQFLHALFRCCYYLLASCLLFHYLNGLV
jgi:hypothetical protein